MLEHNDKQFYSCRELANMSYAKVDEIKELENVWRELFSSHNDFKDINSSQFQAKLMPLAKENKLPHLECTKTSSERKYYFFNIEDIISTLKTLPQEDSNRLLNKFSRVEYVEAK